MILFFSAYLAVRRAMAKDQRRPLHPPLPLWRLLAGEIAVLARRVGSWRVASVTLLVAAAVLVVEVALTDTTPGPTLATPWRWIVAAAAAFVVLCCWAVVHALRSTREEIRKQDDRESR